MANNLGFRVGLLLDQFFSDRRRKCYFFVNTDKIQSILELKETLIDKFSLPSNVQLMHNGFLLLDEDTVFVVRQDEAIEVVLGSPVKKKSPHKNKSKHSNHSLISEDQQNRSDNKSIKTEAPLVNGKNDDIFNPSVSCVSNSSPGTDRPKKKKKRKHEASFENDQSLDITAEVAGGIKFHSSPYSYLCDEAKNSAGRDAKVQESFYNHACGSAKNFGVNESKPHAMSDSSAKETSALKKVNFQPATESIKEEECSDNSRSHKRKWKNEQNRLKYSGVAELIKQMQSNNEGPSVENGVEMDDAEIDNSDVCPKMKRKRVRRRKKKNKADESSSNNGAFISTLKNAVPANNVVEQCKFQSNPRMHKRFNSEENISSNLEFPGDVYETAKYEVLQEPTLNSKLCNQVSPLTPPSEHNSEDDVYKKLLDLKKLNKPAVFERAQVGEIDMIDDEDSINVNRRLEAEAVSLSFDQVNLNPEPMKLMDQPYCDESIMQFEPVLNVPRSSSNSDKEDMSRGAENRRSDNNSSRKEPCPVYIKKNICDKNLDEIDINNYPVIESTRENDILVFKTLKLDASSSPTLSSLIVAQVRGIDGNNLIFFEILSGKEEFDFSKDELLIEDNKSQKPSIRLKWTELYEPRLLYP